LLGVKRPSELIVLRDYNAEVGKAKHQIHDRIQIKVSENRTP
jgi:hypothetical protein